MYAVRVSLILYIIILYYVTLGMHTYIHTCCAMQSITSTPMQDQTIANPSIYEPVRFFSEQFIIIMTFNFVYADFFPSNIAKCFCFISLVGCRSQSQLQLRPTSRTHSAITLCS
jgi:hypothetical protein